MSFKKCNLGPRTKLVNSPDKFSALKFLATFKNRLLGCQNSDCCNILEKLKSTAKQQKKSTFDKKTNLFVEAMLFLYNKCAIKAPWKASNGAEEHYKQKKCYRLSNLEKKGICKYTYLS